jgi:hypothetical protein
MSLRIAAACVWLVGCAAELSLHETEQLALKPGGDGGCPVWGCGSNSPEIAGIEFHEAHETGLANAEGFRILKFEKYVSGAWQAFRPDVIDDQLVARRYRSNVIAYASSEVEGGRFEVEHEKGKYHLYVIDVRRMPLWATPHGQTRFTYTYYLRWISVTGGLVAVNLCGANPDDNDNMADFHAVLFADDRIDPDKLEVYGETADWFNIGCAGSALAKQHLLAHTRAAGALTASATTLAQRTANLKMLTADYCGVGAPFTVPGQRLHWRDANNWYNDLPSAGEIEARWTAAGAICLNTPRVDAWPTPQGVQTFPEGVERLLEPSAGWCTAANPRPPPCTGSMSDMQGAHVISVNHH